MLVRWLKLFGSSLIDAAMEAGVGWPDTGKVAMAGGGVPVDNWDVSTDCSRALAGMAVAVGPVLPLTDAATSPPATTPF